MSYRGVQELFARRLEEIRESRGMTKRAFAKSIHISYGSYDYYTNKGGMPNLYTALVIAKALDMSLDKLLGIKGGTNET